MKMKTRTLNVRIPQELLSWIDTLVESKIYNNRSEAIRNMIREHLIKKK